MHNFISRLLSVLIKSLVHNWPTIIMTSCELNPFMLLQYTICYICYAITKLNKIQEYILPPCDFRINATIVPSILYHLPLITGGNLRVVFFQVYQCAKVSNLFANTAVISGKQNMKTRARLLIIIAYHYYYITRDCCPTNSCNSVRLNRCCCVKNGTNGREGEGRMGVCLCMREGGQRSWCMMPLCCHIFRGKHNKHWLG